MKLLNGLFPVDSIIENANVFEYKSLSHAYEYMYICYVFECLQQHISQSTFVDRDSAASENFSDLSHCTLMREYLVKISIYSIYI